MSMTADQFDERAGWFGTMAHEVSGPWKNVCEMGEYWLRRAAQEIRDRDAARPSESPRMSVVVRGPDCITVTTAEGSRDWVPARGSIVEGLESLREAGGDAWDAVTDPEEYLGRKEPDVARLLEALAACRSRFVTLEKVARDSPRRIDPNYLAASHGMIVMIDQAVAGHEDAKGAGG